MLPKQKLGLTFTVLPFIRTWSMIGLAILLSGFLTLEINSGKK